VLNLFVVRHPKQHPTQIQVRMTLPTLPHAIFSTFAFLANTHNPDKKAKELKMPTPQSTHPG